MKFLTLLLLLMACVPLASAEDCFLNPVGVNQMVVEVHNCIDGNATPQDCRYVELVALTDDTYFISFSDGSYTQRELLTGDSWRVDVPDGATFAHFGVSSAGSAGTIDIIEGVCPEPDDSQEPPDDDMQNWQAGDSFFRVYVDGARVTVYSTITGEGVLILDTEVAACSADGTACYNGIDTVTMIDPEGKTYIVNIID